MNAQEYLREAQKTMDDRAAEYDAEDGSPEGQERSMEAVVEAFNAITKHNLTEAQGWMFMAVLKMVRQENASGYHHDSAVDSVSYTALMSEALSERQYTIKPADTLTGSSHVTEVVQHKQPENTRSVSDFTNMGANMHEVGRSE